MIPKFVARMSAQWAAAAQALSPLLLLATRLFVSWQFWKSGYLKISSWDSTVYLFANEFHVPLLPPQAAALLGTFGELFFPTLLILGLFGRIGALGLGLVNLMAVISYRHVLFADGFEAAIGQHYLWGYMLLVLLVYGPGTLSVDHLMRPLRTRPSSSSL
jgi:putative oxidoreductase